MPLSIEIVDRKRIFSCPLLWGYYRSRYDENFFWGRVRIMVFLQPYERGTEERRVQCILDF